LPKATDAFRNIGEVSIELGVKKHVLRFWEAKFPQLKPMKRGGGRRYYRPADVQLLRGIKHLLQTARYSIRGVQKILREQGPEAVKNLAKLETGGRDKARTSVASPALEAPATRQLSSAEIKVLREVAVTLESVHALLAGAHKPGAAAAARDKRNAARA
jgi:DNA-binding transcriptional MerR regulator